MRYHLTLLRMAIIKKSTNNTCWRGCGEQGTLLRGWWECKWIQSSCRTVWKFTTANTPWEKQQFKDTYTPVFVHCSTIYNSQDMETTLMSMDRWMDKEAVLCIYSGIWFSHKRECIWVSCSEVDEPRSCYTELSKSKRKKYHILTCIYGI